MSLIAKWEKVIGVKAERLYIRRMKTKWGSCNHQAKTIRLNTDLANKPRECLEYVVVHELVHRLERVTQRALYRAAGAVPTQVAVAKANVESIAGSARAVGSGLNCIRSNRKSDVEAAFTVFCTMPASLAPLYRQLGCGCLG